MKIYENIEAERDRIQECIRKFGWTSDHNLDWFADCIISEDGKPVFIQFSDETGLLAHKYKDQWRIWSDPLCSKNLAVDKILEFSEFAIGDGTKEVWCDDVSDSIRPSLIDKKIFTVGDIYYSLLWPVLDMEKYDPAIPGGHFKEIRNAKNKFYREHKVEVVALPEIKKPYLHRIVDDWKKAISHKEDIYEFKYHNAINNDFEGFITSRVLLVDGEPVGLNAGYEAPNNLDRFAGIVGIHNYSFNDLGLILWLEDLEWIKAAGYKEMDMQGSEEGGGLKFKMQFNPVIERKTDTFLIMKK